MSTTEQIYALLVTANPVPDWNSLSGAAADTKPRLRLVAPATKATQSQQQEPSMEVPRLRRLVPWLGMAAAIALVTTTAIILAGGGPSVDSRPFVDSAPSTTTTPAPTTTETARTPGQHASAMSITEAGLPTEWGLTLGTQLIEVEEVVRLDSDIRLDGDSFTAEGTAFQVVQTVDMVEGAVVECAGTTYDEEFLWSAAPQGTGELDFGDAGSVTIEFDAVLVTSSSLAGRATGRFGPRVCGEWSGTYTGASGDLADASGTFTAVFGVASGATDPVWTFDS